MTERDIQAALYWRHRSNCSIMLPNYMPLGWQECDILVVTNAGYATEYEIKLSVSDFRADFNKAKHARMATPLNPALRERWMPTRFFFAVPEGLVPLADVPSYAGLMEFRIVGRRLRPTTPVETIVRPAPRLRPEKVPDRMIQHMQRTAYYRFWNERMAFDRYRRDVDATREADVHTPTPCKASGALPTRNNLNRSGPGAVSCEGEQ